ncbi:MAG TPA: VCBS repeat-containing protein [Planctomycetota bacterium]|nr:VCBS repeat-containing protein [Planctomycetota bacterium]
MPGDFDGDGTLDLFLLHYSALPYSAGFEVLSRLANGTWGTRAGGGVHTAGVVVAELTGDDRPEVVMTQSDPSQTYFGILSFSRRMEMTAVLSAHWSYPVYGDLALLRGDADALPDLFSFNDGAISFHRRVGGALFAAPVTTAIATSASVEAIYMRDFTGDGYADAAYIDYAGQIRVYRGDGAGGFLPPVVTPLPFYVPGGFAPITAELNGDNRPDLIVQGRVLLAASNGSFQITAVVLPAVPLDSGDFDGDGRTDVLCHNGIHLQQPGMSFVAGPATAFGGPYENCAVLDVNQDGRLDILRLRHSTTGPIKLTLVAGVLPHAPPSVWPYGIGTPGCHGHAALSANATPALGLQQFAITATNAPESAPGVLLFYIGYWQPVFVELFGFHLSVSPFAPPTNLTLVPFDSNGYGQARLALPLPATGLPPMDFQACWLSPAGDGACSASPFGFVSSNALHVQ